MSGSTDDASVLEFAQNFRCPGRTDSTSELSRSELSLPKEMSANVLVTDGHIPLLTEHIFNRFLVESSRLAGYGTP